MMHKKIIVVCLALLSFVSFEASAQKKSDDKTATVVFSSNISCDNCKRRIESNIPYEKGVKDLKVDLGKKTVTVTYRTDKTDSDKLLDALNKLGYKSFISEAHEGKTKQDDK